MEEPEEEVTLGKLPQQPWGHHRPSGPAWRSPSATVRPRHQTTAVATSVESAAEWYYKLTDPFPLRWSLRRSILYLSFYTNSLLLRAGLVFILQRSHT